LIGSMEGGIRARLVLLMLLRHEGDCIGVICSGR